MTEFDYTLPKPELHIVDQLKNSLILFFRTCNRSEGMKVVARG